MKKLEGTWFDKDNKVVIIDGIAQRYINPGEPLYLKEAAENKENKIIIEGYKGVKFLRACLRCKQIFETENPTVEVCLKCRQIDGDVQ